MNRSAPTLSPLDRPWLPRWPLALLPALLAACGGGGGGGSAGGEAPAELASFSLLAAPELRTGSTPSAGAAYACGNVQLGAARTGEIEVPAGQVCVLQGTRVEGNIKLNAGSGNRAASKEDQCRAL